MQEVTLPGTHSTYNINTHICSTSVNNTCSVGSVCCQRMLSLKTAAMAMGSNLGHPPTHLGSPCFVPWPSYLHDAFTTDLTPLVPILTHHIPSFTNSNSFHVCVYYISPSSLSPTEWLFLQSTALQTTLFWAVCFLPFHQDVPATSVAVPKWCQVVNQRLLQGGYLIASPSIAGTSSHPGWI